MTLRRIFRCFILASVFLPSWTEAQITATGQSFKDTIQYPEFKEKDPIYIYNISCRGSSSANVALSAMAPGNADSCNFQWNQYNPSTKLYDIPVKVESLVSQSQVSGLPQGGYQVRVTKTGKVDTTWRAWVFIHHLSASVLKTANGQLPTNKYTCEYLDLNGSFQTDTFYCYDPQTGQKVRLQNNIKPVWQYINQDPDNPTHTIYTDLNQRIAHPPPYDTKYILNVSDDLNAFCSDTVLYVTIQTRAKFKYQYNDNYGKTKGYIEMDAQGVSSPAKFQFTNQSVNGSDFRWILTDTVFQYMSDQKYIFISRDTSEKPEFTYYIPRSYKATLVSVSKEHCVDSAFTDILILIKPSELAVPNIFTPNGDDKNDHFIIYPYDDETTSYQTKFSSIKIFHITIYSRWGKKVHEFEGDINQWVENGGWDGKVKDSNREASPGVYYYIIEATGWDNKVYKGQKQLYTGYLYLYR